MLAPVSLHVPLCPAFRGRVASVYPWEVSDDAGRMWTMRETDGHIGRETFENAGFPVVLAGSKRVQVKGRVALKSPLARFTPPGKAEQDCSSAPTDFSFPETGGGMEEKRGHRGRF